VTGRFRWVPARSIGGVEGAGVHASLAEGGAPGSLSLSGPMASALVIGITLAGCGDASTPESAAVDRAGPETGIEELTFDTLAVLGSPQGQPWEAFGGVWDVAVTSDGRFAVIDFQAPAVHVYGADAGHLGSVAARGSGPGELLGPSGIGWDAGGHLVVWDPSNGRISRYSVDAGGTRFVDQRRAFAFGETGFCTLGDRVYLSFLQDDHVVHEINPDAGIAHSFSPAPDVIGIEAISGGAREMALEDLTPSRLLCAEGRVIEVGFFQPRVQAFSPDGDLLWSRELDDFTPVLPVSPDDMGVGFEYDEASGSHMARSVVPWGANHALVQYEVRRPGPRPAGADFHALESRLIRTDSGEEVSRTWDLPLILASGGDRLFAVRQFPVPQVLVLERH